MHSLLVLNSFYFTKKVSPFLTQSNLYKKPVTTKITGCYVITLTGDSKKAVDDASIEIKAIAEEKNAKVCIISNLNGLIDNMKICESNVIINKCYGMNGNQLTHLARFIRNSVWHPWMFYVGENALIRHECSNILDLGINQIYPLKASIDVKRDELNMYLE